MADRIQQVVETAERNGNHISYYIVMDILTDNKENLLDEIEIDDILKDLRQKDIIIEPDEGTEEYEEGDSTGFIPADVHIMPRNSNISSILERLEFEEIDLEPEFQRKSGLWSDIQQSRLIESLMLKFLFPPFISMLQ